MRSEGKEGKGRRRESGEKTKFDIASVHEPRSFSTRPLGAFRCVQAVSEAILHVSKA